MTTYTRIADPVYGKCRECGALTARRAITTDAPPKPYTLCFMCVARRFPSVRLGRRRAL